MLDEIILKPSKRMVSHFFLGSLTFGLGGMLLLRDHTKAHEVWIVYGCFFASGLSGLLGMWLLFSGRAFLKICSDGLEIGYLRRSFLIIRWTDIETFGVYEYTTYPGGFPIKHKHVGIRLSESSEYAKTHPMMRKIDRALFGYDLNIPSVYGTEYYAMADQLNRKKREFTMGQQ